MEEAEELIRSSDAALPVSKAKLVKALLPRLGFSSYPWLPRGLPIGASRFGGPADLPEGVAWPRAAGRPLLLLAPLNFRDLRIEREQHPVFKRLPEDGWLCLFLDVHEKARGMTGEEPGVVALQFSGAAGRLVRHDPEPAPDAETWTHCHAVTVHPADHHLCLPCVEAVESPLPAAKREEWRETYDQLRFEIEDLKRTSHEATLLGSPTLFNPDPRDSLARPDEWMLLLEFRDESSWLAGAAEPEDKYLRRPSIGADFVQYFVRKTDYDKGRLDRGFLDYMMT